MNILYEFSSVSLYKMILDIEDLLLTCFTLLFQKMQYLTIKDNSTSLLKRNDSGFHWVKFEMGGQQTS